jgi:Domain of unknown function (DUF1707)
MLTTRAASVHTRWIEDPALSLRASDADREQVARALRHHLVAGRLAADEFEQRIEHAYAAGTVDDLRELTRDLPSAPAEPARAPPRGRLLPGNRPFVARLEVDRPASVVISEAMRTVAPNLMGARYRLERSDPTRLVFRREQYPFLSVLAAVLVPFVGLIVLLAAGRETSEIVVSANEVERGRTVVDVFGVASMRVRRAMLELQG